MLVARPGKHLQHPSHMFGQRWSKIMTKHINAIALALLHLPFQSRAFNTILRAGNCDRHLTHSKPCCDQGLRLRMVNGGIIYGKSASVSRLSPKDPKCVRSQFPLSLRPNMKSFSTKMTANDVFNVEQDWQDLKRSIQAIEPKYRSFFCPTNLNASHLLHNPIPSAEHIKVPSTRYSFLIRSRSAKACRQVQYLCRTLPGH
jgi:hypothetical protein